MSPCNSISSGTLMMYGGYGGGGRILGGVILVGRRSFVIGAIGVRFFICGMAGS